MSARDDRAAFPALGRLVQLPGSGMSMREYFAAHAPACPDWFRYEALTPRPAGAPSPLGLSTAQRDQVVMLLNADIPEDIHPDPAVAEFARKVNEAKAAHNIWRDEQRERKFFAWRWHYADMMLAGRSQ